LVCRPQVPTPYKRDDDSRADESQDARCREEDGGRSIGRRKRGGDQRKKEDVEAALATAVRAETDRSVLLELIFDRLDPGRLQPFSWIA
jgi:hypothetical protein